MLEPAFDLLREEPFFPATDVEFAGTGYAASCNRGGDLGRSRCYKMAGMLEPRVFGKLQR